MVIAQSQQHLSRRPFSACFAKNEKLLIVGEIEGILELFSLMIPESHLSFGLLSCKALKDRLVCARCDSNLVLRERLGVADEQRTSQQESH